MSTKSTLDKWQEYVEFQKMVSIIGRQTTMIFDGLIELADENEEIRFPSYITVIREVTGDPAYKNAALAGI